MSPVAWLLCLVSSVLSAPTERGEVLRAAVHGVFTLQPRPELMAIELERHPVGPRRGVHDSLDLVGAEIPGESFVAWKGRANPCATSKASVCKWAATTTVSVTLGQPAIRGDSAVVRAIVVRRASGRRSGPFTEYEIVLVPVLSGWKMAGHKRISWGGR